MAFYLTVSGGADEGRTFRLDSGDYLIGRSPSSKIVLKDESVAWEHAVAKVDSGKVTIQNLSAIGTRIKGRKIAEPTRLASHDEIQLTDECRLVFEQRVAGGSTSPLAIGLLGVILVALIGFSLTQLNKGSSVQRPMEPRHWRQGYSRIEQRLDRWVENHYFPEEIAVMFRNAWRYDQVGANKEAAELWERINSVLLSLKIPGSSPDDHRTCVQIAGATPRTLQVLMGWDLQNQVGDSDEAYVDALVWFAKKRGQRTRAMAKG